MAVIEGSKDAKQLLVYLGNQLLLACSMESFERTSHRSDANDSSVQSQPFLFRSKVVLLFVPFSIQVLR